MPSDLPPSVHTREIIKWVQLALEEGEAFLNGQENFDKIEDTMNAIFGRSTEQKPATLSQVSLNMFGKVAIDLKAALTDTKPFWDYRTFNKNFEQQSQIGNKLARGWYVRSHQDLKMADVIAYAMAAGTGYAHLNWNDEIEDQDILPEDPRDVIPIRPSTMISLQDAMGVIIRRERTVNYLRAKYPGKNIRADRDASQATIKKQTRARSIMSALGLSSGFVENLYASLGGRPQAQALNVPVADVFTIYVKDDSRNETGQTVQMGRIAGMSTNWSYDVEPGEKLYPRKRMIVLTRSDVLYDDTSIYWHGLFPLAKLTLDPWPFGAAWLGKAPLVDLLPIQREIDKLCRIISQHHQRVERPGLIADKNAVGRAAMERIDTARAGLKLRTNPISGKGAELIHEPQLDASVAAERDFLIERMKDISGARDASQLANLGQVPAAETVERILETMSPAVRLRSRVMEAFISEFAMMTLSNFFQFYTLPQRIAVLGRDGMTFEDFDYDPESLIPDMVEQLGKSEKGDPKPRDIRARAFLKYFQFHVAPGSLLASAGITDKMMYLQLFRMGIMDAWTLLERLEVPNVGQPPDGANSIMDRIKAQMQLGLQPQQSAAGRPPSAQSSPRMTIKES